MTGTVESISLIASSIMSKKMAEGLDALVLDVKVGDGAFMKKQVDARRLAQAMVGIGRRLDKKVQALITDMNQPLGYRGGQCARSDGSIADAAEGGSGGSDAVEPRACGAHDLIWAR